MKKAWRDSIERFLFNLIMMHDDGANDIVLSFEAFPLCFDISNALSVSRPVDFCWTYTTLGLISWAEPPLPKRWKKQLSGPKGWGVRCGFGGGIWTWRYTVGHCNTRKKWVVLKCSTCYALYLKMHVWRTYSIVSIDLDFGQAIATQAKLVGEKLVQQQGNALEHVFVLVYPDIIRSYFGSISYYDFILYTVIV